LLWLQNAKVWFWPPEIEFPWEAEAAVASEAASGSAAVVPALSAAIARARDVLHHNVSLEDDVADALGVAGHDALDADDHAHDFWYLSDVLFFVGVLLFFSLFAGACIPVYEEPRVVLVRAEPKRSSSSEEGEALVAAA